jgi:flavorubredoxin
LKDVSVIVPRKGAAFEYPKASLMAWYNRWIKQKFSKIVTVQLSGAWLP